MKFEHCYGIDGPTDGIRPQIGPLYMPDDAMSLMEMLSMMLGMGVIVSEDRSMRRGEKRWTLLPNGQILLEASSGLTLVEELLSAIDTIQRGSAHALNTIQTRALEATE
jgi:hypothetical protein